jgi:ribosomal protein S18 acetylase RimI-like enzyme
MFRVREAEPSYIQTVKLLDKKTVWEQMEKEERDLIEDFDRYHDEFWRRMTQSKGTAFYVAVDSEGEVVGMVWLSISERISGVKFGWIHDITVDERFRGRDIGRMLLQHAVEHFKAIGIRMIGLMALVDNQPARELYGKEGFHDYSVYMLKTLE